jgi:hypothetical protein
MLRRLRFSSCVPPPRPAASLALRTPFARMFANVIGGHELRANTNEQEMFIRLKADMCDDPAVDSNRVVSGVLSLAKCDPRLVVSDWPCHPDIEAAVDGWIADYCVFSPDA